MADAEQVPEAWIAPVLETWWVRHIGESSTWHKVQTIRKPLLGAPVQPDCCGITFAVAAVAPTAQGRFCQRGESRG